MERLVEVEYVGPNRYLTLDGRWEMRRYPMGVGPTMSPQGYRLRLDGNPESDTNHRTLFHARLHVAALRHLGQEPEKP